MTIVTVSVILILLTGAHAVAQAAYSAESSNCAVMNERFDSVMRESDYAREQAKKHLISPAQSEKVWVATAAKAIDIVDDAIREQLTAGAQPSAIGSMIQCVKSPYTLHQKYATNTPLNELPTNTPLVVPYLTGKAKSYLIAFILIRGSGEVVSRLQLWTRRAGSWNLSATAGKNFNNSTFGVMPLSAPKSGRHWILLLGRPMGETATKFELIEDTGTALESLWVKPPMERVTVLSVSGRKITLRQYKGDDLQHKESVYEVTTYSITASGLQKIASRKQAEAWFPRSQP